MSVVFSVSGKSFALDSLPAGWRLTRRPGGWCLAEGPAGERLRFMAFESGGKFSAQIGGKLYFGSVAAARGGAAAGSDASDGDLTAQFPGKIRKVLVKDGQLVKAGEALVLVEAMKMEFTIRAPRDGRVSGLKATDGQQVSPGDRFLEVVASNG